MKKIPSEKAEEFIAAAHRIAGYGLVRCAGGNLSMRLDEEYMIISAGGSWLECITADRLALCRIADAGGVMGPVPSSEATFHAGIMRTRSDVNVVLHFQSPDATAIACRVPPFERFNIIPEIPYYCGRVASLPYFDPGSGDLAEAVVGAAEDHNVILMRSHGEIAVGDTIDIVIQRAMFFELACGIIIKNNAEVDGLSQKSVDYLVKGNI